MGGFEAQGLAPGRYFDDYTHRTPYTEAGFMGIPVNYRRRVGISSVTGSFAGAFLLGCRMMLLVLGYRFGLHGRSRRLWQDLSAAHIHARNGRRGPVHAGLAAPAPR